MPDSLPILNISSIHNVTQTTAICEGSVLSDAGANVTERGFCWGFKPEPTIKNNPIKCNSGTGNFNDTIVGLNADMTFYVRAYAINANGVGYSNVQQITTLPDAGMANGVFNPNLTYGILTDVEGNTYQTITIGNQTWMAENLISTKFRNGENIPTITDNEKWRNLKTAAQSTYNNGNDSNSIHKFGRFYNYYAVVDSRNIAPAGWHVATDAEWTSLIDYLNSNLGISKSVAQALAAKIDWTESNIQGAIGCIDSETYSSINNSTGFCALPSGIRTNTGEFNSLIKYSAWWTTKENNNYTSWFRSLNFYGLVPKQNFYNKEYGLSVRCVKD